MTTFKRAVCASTLAAGIGLAGLLGTGIGTAAADPGCNAPGRPPCGPDFHDDHGRDDHGGDFRDDRGGPRPDWNNRGIDDGRRDHQPFNWNGQQVNPVLGADGHSWGFWFLGMWIPL